MALASLIPFSRRVRELVRFGSSVGCTLQTSFSTLFVVNRLDLFFGGPGNELVDSPHSHTGCGRGDRHIHDLVLGSGMRTGPAGRTASRDRGAPSGDPPWRGQTASAKIYDRGHEAHCSPADRRNRDFVRPGATRLPGNIRGLEVAIRDETHREGAIGGCDPGLNSDQVESTDGWLRPRGVPSPKFGYKTRDLCLRIDR
jgi:hypothetical protein